MNPIKYIDQLEQSHALSKTQWIELLNGRSTEIEKNLFERARCIQQEHFGNRIFIRGLIEISNYCKNDCYYCGIRKGNHEVARYRLEEADILECCKEGYALGFRTFVMQGGEDAYFTKERMCHIIRSIKELYPDCAITLSIGEKTREEYEAYYEAGADRYLLRHETANEAHYRQLHPQKMLFSNRQRCLKDLLDIGYQTGCGFMVGTPGQTIEMLADEMLYLKEMHPQMIGIGPFLPHHETPFAKEAKGSAAMTVYLLGLIRLMLPDVLLPATTALGTIDDNGREMGVLAGANVVMPNLSPASVREKYMLYDNKVGTGADAAEGVALLSEKMKAIGYEVVTDRGDYKEQENECTG